MCGFKPLGLWSFVTTAKETTALNIPFKQREITIFKNILGFFVAQLVKNLPAVWESWVQSLHWEDPLEKGKATHSSILAWSISWIVYSMGSKKVRHS